VPVSNPQRIATNKIMLNFLMILFSVSNPQRIATNHDQRRNGDVD